MNVTVTLIFLRQSLIVKRFSKLSTLEMAPSVLKLIYWLFVVIWRRVAI